VARPKQLNTLSPSAPIEFSNQSLRKAENKESFFSLKQLTEEEI
jgi:hypothetical protein